MSNECNEITQASLEKLVMEELAEPQTIRLAMTRADAMAVAGFLQLALRHPAASTTEAARIIKAIVAMINVQFPPALREVVRRGWQDDHEPTLDEAHEPKGGPHEVKRV